ncbi:hypothetical protein O181_011079 [Austropuccinia psidii MF-1]|uniref:Reverse transcriptase domain-containing protein n=1 Tax=Austropuccinia psidii MF-1 TaxID=1389203 RepID=A0A9Q3BTU6_9BASI|nr:hypothetical protein [Austropuccinia psidii MF-1]
MKDVGEDVAISSLHLFQGDMDLPPLLFHASPENQWDDDEESEEIETVMKAVPPSYHHFLNVFSKVKAEKLPAQCACDHRSELEGLLPPAYISDNVEKGFIRIISSSTGAAVLFVKKKDGGLHLCVEDHKLNDVPRKDRYPVPPMNQLLTSFNGPTTFSKRDLRGAYNLLRTKEGDENLTSFRTKYGRYEYLEIPFVLKNSPSSFQTLVNDISADLVEIFVAVYLNYIMVFSKTDKEHVKNVAAFL